MTPPPVDPNAVLMTGENSFIRLSHDGGKTLATRASHWRVLWCPAGSGHTLFVQSDLTDNKPRGLRRQPRRRALAADLDRVAPLPDLRRHEPAVIAATLGVSVTPTPPPSRRSTPATDHIRLTWWDTIEPFVLTMAPGTNNRPIGVFSTFFPRAVRAARAERALCPRARCGPRWRWRPAGFERHAGLVGDLGQARG
jgi:hypothetical protein